MLTIGVIAIVLIGLYIRPKNRNIGKSKYFKRKFKK